MGLSPPPSSEFFAEFLGSGSLCSAPQRVDEGIRRAAPEFEAQDSTKMGPAGAIFRGGAAF